MNEFSSNKSNTKNIRSSISKNDKKLSLTGVINDYSMDNIPVRLVYDITIESKHYSKVINQEMNQDAKFIEEELRQFLNKVILTHCKPIFSTNSIISLPNAVKHNEDNLLENIKTNLSSYEVKVEKFSIRLATTPEIRPKKGRDKILSWLLNLIYIIGIISALIITFHFK